MLAVMAAADGTSGDCEAGRTFTEYIHTSATCRLQGQAVFVPPPPPPPPLSLSLSLLSSACRHPLAPSQALRQVRKSAIQEPQSSAGVGGGGWVGCEAAADRRLTWH